jgi:hypothetical protein
MQEYLGGSHYCDHITQILTKSPDICFFTEYGKKNLSLSYFSPPWRH